MDQDKANRPESASAADQIVDELMPESFDWRLMVRTYPLPSLAVAAATGFVLGRSHGSVLLSALTAFAIGEVSKNINSLLGDEVL